jgi:23S rRNA pseudouridine1911/1915/1917 synthase
VLAETQQFLVINKPAGLPSQATLTSSEDTVIHALCSQYPNKYKLDDLFLVHRLDKDTSGVMLIAKGRASQNQLEQFFLQRKMKKSYVALALGIPSALEGDLTWPIRKDSSRANTYMAVMGASSARSAQVKSKDVKSAITAYLVLKTFPKLQASFIECRPETGRTHQIRVHLQALGVPLFGDKTYANNVIGHPCGQWAARHMLHAQSISWQEADGRTFAFDAPLPDDFRVCLNRLEQEG